MRFIYSILGLVAGIAVLKYSSIIYNFVGHDVDMERIFGSGGTHTFIKLVGLVFVVLSLLYLFKFL